MVVARLVLYQAAAKLISEFEKNGFEILQGDSFADAAKALPKVKGGLTPHFAHSLNGQSKENAAWIGLRLPGEKKFCGFAAIRLEPLQGMVLSDFWASYWRLRYDDVNGNPVQMTDAQPEIAKRISGQVGYLGDLWIRPDLRKLGYARRLMELAQLLAFDLWRLDWIYCWMRPADFLNGNGARWGWMVGQPDGIRFEVPARDFPEGLALCANPSYALTQLIEDIARDA
ncbi:Acetyltransferase (GNAT) family protein [Pseudovibrio denitrificans]|uniref:Acetyltransferase (GNAT) family protein n=1 Tax=Pseudovibrio denitrificans TaxID=258256 RepID=A0A1I7BMR6_9HYPH|nr:GNAT family N-acetyltransferase [Pseudovibrio denitrificans]SFT88446.1 Acetyltransferase (GNAT) family protein [Pseudovibrio denitrificans]